MKQLLAVVLIYWALLWWTERPDMVLYWAVKVVGFGIVCVSASAYVNAVNRWSRRAAEDDEGPHPEG